MYFDHDRLFTHTIIGGYYDTVILMRALRDILRRNVAMIMTGAISYKGILSLVIPTPKLSEMVIGTTDSDVQTSGILWVLCRVATKVS